MTDLDVSIRRFLLIGIVLGGCEASNDADPSGTSEDAPTSGPASTTNATSTTASTTSATTMNDGSTAGDGSSSGMSEDPLDDADAFYAAIAGLWVAPVTSWTSAGSFPTMNMDVRPADDHTLFSRVDLDPDNSLRFAFTLEEHEGSSQLTFRNGGEFLGILRDTRAVLHEVDTQAGTWRFCALGAGCGYVDATFTFTGEDTMQLDVSVMGMQHIDWNATRREERPLEDFAASDAQPGDQPFPPMPQLEVHTHWNDPLEAPARVWVTLSTTQCGLNPLANCVPSRFLSIAVPAGATDATLTLEQMHGGEYFANAVLDRNENLASGALLPDSGDAVALPDTPASVPSQGSDSVDVQISFEIE